MAETICHNEQFVL